jgi:acetoin utilization deacetylase AcuC-like enzyme
MGDADYGAIFSDLIGPVLEAYKPGLVLVSAGFDPYVRDPLGGMAVSEEGFAAVCSRVRDAARASGAPLGLVLEGGYDLGGLARSVRACVEVLAGGSAPLRTGASFAGAGALRIAQSVHRARWKL